MGTTALSTAITTQEHRAYRPPTGLQRTSAILILALGYFATAKLGLILATVGGNVSPFWPPTGLAIAALLRFGPGLWPGIFLGSLATNFSSDLVGWNGALVATGNTVEPLVAWWLLGHLSFRRSLDRPRDVLAYLIVAGALAPIASATVGVVALVGSDRLDGAFAPAVWQTWWLGNAMGALIIGPGLLLCPPLTAWSRLRRKLEAVALVAVITALAAALFFSGHEPEGMPPFLSYLALPVLMWPAFRFGQTGVALSLALFGILATLGLVVSDFGPEDFTQLIDAVITLQAYLALAVASGLLIGSLIQQRGLAESQLQMASHALDGAADMVLWLGDDGSVLYANQAAQRLLESSGRPLQGSAFATLCGDLDHACWAQLWRALASEDQVLDLTLFGRDGTAIPTEATISRLEFQDRTYACAILRDLSERHRLEAELFQAQKMDALGRLAGGIAHDFNNMLAAIRGNGELALSGDRDPDVIRHHLQTVLATCDHAADLTSQILVFSRNQITEPVPLELGPAIERVVALTRRTIPESITIAYDPPADPIWVRADPTRLQQVLVNLVVNARDAMSDGGAIAIGLAIRIDDDEASGCRRRSTTAADQDPRPSAPVPPRWVEIAVTDQGVGIPTELQGTIFEPFFTTKGPGHGTGLGLAIAHAAVTQMGGRLRVRSEPGHGSTFRIILPLLATGSIDGHGGRAPHSVARAPDEEQAIGRGRRVLLVEDHPDVRALAIDALEAMGFAEVISAENGRAALDAVAGMPGGPDLVVSDVVMPQLDGPGLVRDLRARFGPLPVVFLSGYPDEHLGDQLPDHAAFIAKPFTLPELRRTIQALLAAHADRRAG